MRFRKSAPAPAPAKGPNVKTAEEIGLMRTAGRLLREVREKLEAHVKPGMTTRQLDRIAKRLMDERGAIPSFLGYNGFPATLCISVNEQVVHGIPSDRILEEGDIVSVDMGLIKHGFHADTAKTYAVGRIDPESARLIETTEAALMIGIPALRAGNRLGDFGAVVQAYVEARGYSVVRDYAGHGVGRKLHEEPRVPNFGKPGKGDKLVPGMVLAVEPMVNQGTHKTKVLGDQWTVVTADGKRSAHAEHTVAVTEDGPEILT